MARESDSYFCSQCQKEVPAAEVKQIGHSIGRMHDIEGCRSGRVAPIWREQGDK